jgi:hypothetical protein
MRNSVNLAAAMGVLALFAIAHPITSQPTPVREADAPCAACHKSIFNAYLNTPMANASGLATEKLRAGQYVHVSAGIQYEVAVHNGVPALEYQAVKNPKVSATYPLTYFLGSGHLGTTYLYTIGDFLFESPIAWYATSQRYEMKPGLAGLKYMPPPLPMQSGCLRCHMSSVKSSDSGTINRYTGLPFLHTGITCEACHGDSGQHVETGGKASIVNPARLNADLRDSICISCHLEGDVTVERAGHPALGYRPGEPISTYLAFFVRSGSNLLDRGVSEVEQLSDSTCKRASGDRMSCLSCHDPHYTPGASDRAAFYRAKCLACHNQAHFAETHHPENPDCTRCHMPRTGARNIIHVAWTDHRIRKTLDAATQDTQVKESNGRLTPIFSPGVTTRDEAMANYRALLEGDPSREVMVREQLYSLRETLGNDKEALDALGNISAEHGDKEIADQAFRRVLALDPSDLTALSNIGVLLAKQGHLKEGKEVLVRAFDRNQDIPGLAMNLARIQCLSGDAAAAHNTLRAALFYAPNSAQLQDLQNQMNDCNASGTK